MAWSGGRTMFAFAAMALVVSGCVDGDAGSFTLDDFPEAERAAVETIEKGSYSGYETPGFTGEVATNQAQWERLWAKHTSNEDPAPAAPSVDFTSKFVAAAFMGRQHSGGHAIDVVDVPFVDGKFHAGYATVRPGQDCMTAQAITYPFDIVAVDRMGVDDVDVVFHNAGKNTRDC